MKLTEENWLIDEQTKCDKELSITSDILWATSPDYNENFDEA